MIIVVPSYCNQQELTIVFLIKLPFTAIRPWREKLSENKDEPQKLSIPKLPPDLNANRVVSVSI